MPRGRMGGRHGMSTEKSQKIFKRYHEEAYGISYTV